MICLGRAKAKANHKVTAAQHQAKMAASKDLGVGQAARDGTPLTEVEWLVRVRRASYASKVRKRGLYNPEYKERYLVLDAGILKWFILSEMHLDEYDQYDWAILKLRASGRVMGIE